MNQKKSRTFEPGRRYRGSASLNEYGEFQFTPYNEKDVGEGETASLVKKTKGFTINLYKDVVSITIRVDRHQDRNFIKDKAIEELVSAFAVLNNYEL